MEDYYDLSDTNQILNNTKYGQTVRNISKYIDVFGMFENKNGPSYQVYNNITPDLYNWKRYNSSLRVNDHKMIELNIPLDDVTFLGTNNFIQNIDEVVNRFQVRINETTMPFDSY